MDFENFLKERINFEVESDGTSPILDGIERWLISIGVEETEEMDDKELVNAFLKYVTVEIKEKLIWIITHSGGWPKSLDREDWWTCEIPIN